MSQGGDLADGVRRQRLHFLEQAQHADGLGLARAPASSGDGGLDKRRPVLWTSSRGTTRLRNPAARCPLGGDRLAGQEQLPRERRTEPAQQTPQPRVAVDEPQPHRRYPQPRPRRHHAQIAAREQFHRAAPGVALGGDDHRRRIRGSTPPSRTRRDRAPAPRGRGGRSPPGWPPPSSRWRSAAPRRRSTAPAAAAGRPAR